MSIVTTGQITIVDTNDARPITAYMSASPSQQQVYTKDESLISFTPSWWTANGNTGLQINAYVYVGTATGAQDVTNQLTNRKFCLTVGGAALAASTASSNFVDDNGNSVSNPFTVLTDASNTYLRIRGNLKDTVASMQVYFEADYVDTYTGLTTHILASIGLNTVKTGTNAVYVNVRGNNIIEQATGSTKSVVAISADLVRSSGVDNTGITYKWYGSNAATQISTAVAGYAAKYGLKTVNAPTLPTAAVSDLGVNVPVVGTGTIHNTLIVSEAAIVDQDIFRVDVTDADAKTYTAYFTVYDITDPYELKIFSSTGDKLQNGQGNTTLTPVVYYGAKQVTDLTGWKFNWYFYDRNAKRGAFVDTAKISTAGGGNITAHTSGASAAFSCTSVTAGMFAPGEIIKVVRPSGDAFFYEVGATSTAGSVSVRAPVTNADWLTTSNFPLPTNTTDFVGGKLFGCVGNKGVRQTTGATGIVLTGDEVDVKSVISVEADRP